MVAERAQSRHPASARCTHQSDGPRLQPPRGRERSRFRGGESGRQGVDDRKPGLVAGRLGTLRRPDDPSRLALRRLIPPAGRPRRRRLGQYPLCPAELLAGQCQPGQGAPPVVAGQKEIRQRAVLGRSHHPLRQHGLRVHGPEDVRFRLWPRGHLGPGNGRVLGFRAGMARTVRKPLRRPR